MAGFDWHDYLENLTGENTLTFMGGLLSKYVTLRGHGECGGSHPKEMEGEGGIVKEAEITVPYLGRSWKNPHLS